MSAKIYSFNKAQKEKSDKPKEEKISYTDAEIFDHVYADLIDEWQIAARNNRLNELIGDRLPSKARGPKNADYVNDLNTISNVEAKLELVISVNAPTFSGNKVGWMVIFKYNDEAYAGPADMFQESYARAFNILLFVEFQSRLKKLKQ